MCFNDAILDPNKPKFRKKRRFLNAAPRGGLRSTRVTARSKAPRLLFPKHSRWRKNEPTGLLGSSRRPATPHQAPKNQFRQKELPVGHGAPTRPPYGIRGQGGDVAFLPRTKGASGSFDTKKSHALLYKRTGTTPNSAPIAEPRPVQQQQQPPPRAPSVARKWRWYHMSIFFSFHSPSSSINFCTRRVSPMRVLNWVITVDLYTAIFDSRRTALKSTSCSVMLSSIVNCLRATTAAWARSDLPRIDGIAQDCL